MGILKILGFRRRRRLPFILRVLGYKKTRRKKAYERDWWKNQDSHYLPKG